MDRLGIARVQWVAAAILVTPYGIYGLPQSSFAWPSLLATMAVGSLGTGLAFVMMALLASRRETKARAIRAPA